MNNIKRIERKITEVTAPPAKAYTLRALIISSLAQGKSIIHNPLLGEDQLNLIECLKNLGVEITSKGNTLSVTGSAGKFSPLKNELFAGESGVSMNVLASIASLVDEPITLTGAEGLLARPIGDVVNGLTQLGCDIEYLSKEGFPPILVKSGTISGGITKMSGKKTSQYFSSISLTGPFCEKDVNLICTDDMSEKPYFDITEEMMSLFGVNIENNDYREISIKNNRKYKAIEMTVEGDYSSASFFMLAAAVCQSTVTITGLNRASKQGDKKFLDYMATMGSSINWTEDKVKIQGRALKPITVHMVDTPDLVPPLAIAAAFAEGTSEFTGVGHLRFKECNRLEAVVVGLEKMGIKAHYDEDSLFVEGNPKMIKGSTIDSYNDHRIAMSFAIAGLAVDGQNIPDKRCVAKSFPDFWERMQVFY